MSIKEARIAQAMFDWTAMARVFALCALAVGCRASVGKSEVIGSWECRRGRRASCVDIQSTGSYTQTIAVSGRPELFTTSTWTWELKPDEGMGILFKGFQHLNDRGDASNKPAGFWLVVPERRVPFGHLGWSCQMMRAFIIANARPRVRHKRSNCRLRMYQWI